MLGPSGHHPESALAQTTVRRLTIGDCQRPTASDIETLIPLSFDLADSAPLPVIANIRVMTVCESPGLSRNTISSFSVVAQFSCTGSACASPGQVQTEQFQYECNSDNTFTVAEISVGNVRTANPTATLQTHLNESCAQCVLSSLFPEAGPDDHCVRKFHVDNNRSSPMLLSPPPSTACLQGCTEGQRRCVGH